MTNLENFTGHERLSSAVFKEPLDIFSCTYFGVIILMFVLRMWLLGKFSLKGRRIEADRMSPYLVVFTMLVNITSCMGGPCLEIPPLTMNFQWVFPPSWSTSFCDIPAVLSTHWWSSFSRVRLLHQSSFLVLLASWLAWQYRDVVKLQPSSFLTLAMALTLYWTFSESVDEGVLEVRGAKLIVQPCSSYVLLELSPVIHFWGSLSRLQSSAICDGVHDCLLSSVYPLHWKSFLSRKDKAAIAEESWHDYPETEAIYSICIQHFFCNA